MSEKPGFMIYHKDMKALVNMTDRDLGALMKLLYAVSLGEEPEPPAKLRVLFEMMAEHIREDAEKYRQKVAQAQRAGQASAEARRRPTDVNGRQRSSTDVNQYQYQSNTNNNYQVHANDREDDMSDVLMNM